LEFFDRCSHPAMVVGLSPVSERFLEPGETWPAFQRKSHACLSLLHFGESRHWMCCGIFGDRSASAASFMPFFACHKLDERLVDGQVANRGRVPAAGAQP